MKTVTIAGPCQTVYEVHTNCGELLRSLRLQFGKYLLEGGGSSGLRIDAVKEGSLYRVGFGGEERETDRPRYFLHPHPLRRKRICRPRGGPGVEGEGVSFPGGHHQRKNNPGGVSCEPGAGLHNG